jgi:hypothetical protein
MYVVDNYGDQYMPIVECLVADLEAMQLRDSPRDKARRMLAAYTIDGGLKAIR